MEQEKARNYVVSLYRNILRRSPATSELNNWVAFAQSTDSAENVYYAFVNSDEFKGKTRVSSLFPPGHFYSPIVDPATVVDYVAIERKKESSNILGIEVPVDKMEAFWNDHAEMIAATPYSDDKDDKYRFYYNNNIFPYGDAISLRAMISHARPKKIVEIGSGFSSACMLDCADEFDLETTFVFIDPYPQRLKGLLRDEDYRRVEIIENPVQGTDLDMYRSLNSGDILFIDSTHVLKTGSDVHYELFHILPALKRGVLIHFHDIQFPFEYPDQWIFNENFSWNEIYALRAFLMYNSSFKIKFWGNCLAHERRDDVLRVYPAFLKNPGSSLWVEKVLKP